MQRHIIFVQNNVHIEKTVHSQTYPAHRKTRIAPTPSGFLHLGNVFSFVLTATLARRTGAAVLLRIDDMDQQRVRPEYVQDIFDTLHFLEIPWEEGPRTPEDLHRQWSQLHREALYQQALEALKEQGKLFACDCTRSRLQQTGGVYGGRCLRRGLSWDLPDVCWRINTETPLPLQMHTGNGALPVALPVEQRHFVVRKKDGHAAYQLASVVDDDYFGVDLVVRGEDLWDSTLAQLYLAGTAAMDRFSRTTFYHHSLLMEAPDKKLSKSEGATSVRYLRKAGKTKADIFSAIAGMLGIREQATGWEALGDLLLDHYPVFRQPAPVQP
ncbi:tRNA glutamyl-Q synthetase [Chitinophaga oryzae]|uniref:tRNA glutamyl-Q synthetase n=1 Tax=Chitinophaga oryzae TaxID=2725414 RepID=A0ABX6LQP9_9BACT|nr:glutamate--tRNA ligase family protein [Chitinophaga oryzae]QJB42020.1 tRNA glutamyl-Q synthetase [Chitinophaga oryzae]